MILYRRPGADRNFADKLNAILWPRLLPNFFDNDASVQLLGIGSVLDGRHNTHGVKIVTHGVKIVAGSGYGGYTAPPTLDRSWVIHWVRGPRTARVLGLPPSLGLGDPAALLPLAGMVGREVLHSGSQIGFMPHFESAARGAWESAASLAGVTIIDPRGEPQDIIAAIHRCTLLLSEALPGVIVADALRVPWIAIQPIIPAHHPEWQDWADTLQLRIVFRRLPPSSFLEDLNRSGLCDFHGGRWFLDRHGGKLRGVLSGLFAERAARALCFAAAATPQLSQDLALQTSQERMMQAVTALRRDPFCGYVRVPSQSVALADVAASLAANATPQGVARVASA